MGRQLRTAVGGLVYHVLNRSNGRRRIFEADSDYEAFEDVMAEACERVPMRILCYCLMPNHWHMVLWPKGDGDLSRFVGWLALTHAQRLHFKKIADTFFLFFLCFLLHALGCSSPVLAAGEVVAELDGVAITSEEIEKPLAAQLSKLEEQIYNLKRQRLEALINEKLLASEAAKRGISASMVTSKPAISGHRKTGQRRACETGLF